jgi:predicted dehydrogenase
LTSNPNFLALTCEYDPSPAPMISTIHLNYVQMPEQHEYEIVGDKGWAMFDLNKGVVRLGRRDDPAAERVEQISTERDIMYEAEHQAFFDAIAGRREPESPAGDAIVSLEIMDAALRSWRAGAPVELAA